MSGPEMTTCVDCVWFKAKCEWLLSRDPNAKSCDWSPSRFLSAAHVASLIGPGPGPDDLKRKQ